MQMHDFHLSVLYLYALHDVAHLCQSLVAFCIIFVASCNHGTMTVAIAKKSFNQLSMVLLSVVRLGLSSSCRAMHYTGIFTIHVSLLIRQKNRAENMFQINSNFHALQLPRNPISSKHIIKSCWMTWMTWMTWVFAIAACWHHPVWWPASKGGSKTISVPWSSIFTSSARHRGTCESGKRWPRDLHRTRPTWFSTCLTIWHKLALTVTISWSIKIDSFTRISYSFQEFSFISFHFIRYQAGAPGAHSATRSQFLSLSLLHPSIKQRQHFVSGDDQRI